ncbi:MAG: SUMF1/EgtB/PvdO family nonheme iron enzyme, partial [Thermoguttaceae bacterium]|nr:SUMF1/EgtB/PvdO family nonheme iron enzyme [Thermoguttaceae bacterium]
MKTACCFVTIAFYLTVAAGAATRTWTDSTGKFSVEADLQEVREKEMVLRRADGSRLTVPLERLSAADRRYLEALAASKTKDASAKSTDRPKTPADSPPMAVAPFDAQAARRHQEAWASHLGQPVELTDTAGMEFVLIPPGEFMMGVRGADSDDGPQHRVRITKPFYLGKYPVTQQQWEAVTGNNPGQFKEPTNPVETVSWNDCQEFLKTLNEKADGPQRTFRLPTEAEWEYACRAGTATRFGFGDDAGQLGEYAWYEANAGGRTQPVGQKKPNAWGLHDMHGNVWEWCADWFSADYYAKSPTDNPPGPVSGSLRALRGGAWPLGEARCRSTNRLRSKPAYKSGILGFRVAL